jgi:putative hydrolase of the HAD superfamily
VIKAVFFDLDDTLYDSTRLARMARIAALEGMINEGLPVSRHEGWKLLNVIVREKGSNFPNHLDLLSQKILGYKDYKILTAGIIAYHNTKFANLKPFGDTVPTLITLRQMGKKLGIITNGKATKQWEKILRLQLEHFFDGVFISEEEGVEKPSREIFCNAISSFGVEPMESIMVDDKGPDLAGAKLCGMVTVLRMRRMRIAADFVIENLSELIGIVGELDGK